MELQLLRGDEVVYVRPVGLTPVYVGRAPSNDLVLVDPKISSRHAVVWRVGDELRVEDLGSRNGILVNGERIQAAKLLKPGDLLLIGGASLRVALGAPRPTEIGAAPLAVEDLAAGLAVPLRTDRFRIGSDPTNDLVLPTGPGRAAVIGVHASGELWLGLDEEQRDLSIGQPFEVSERTLVIRELTDDAVRTEAMESTPYDYRLEASLEGPSGPWAVLVERRTGRSHRVETENRATLLYLLGRQFLRDAASPSADRGWINDDDVATGIWGRVHGKNEPNNYHVLVCRLRREVTDAGLDGWFVEKKRRAIRARLGEVVLA